MRSCKWCCALCAILLIVPMVAGADIAAGNELLDRLKNAGHVLMIRHAHAPGTGDPNDFTIGECATQRNLDERGKAQARRIGKWLRAGGIMSAKVYSSQWCRGLETAQLIGLGPVKELPALNSFFGNPEASESTLAALRAFLAQQPRDGELILLVTHYVNISGIAGVGVLSGEGVVLELTVDGGYKVLGRLKFD
jgi:phosphohistidine phosphatase SixA